MDQLKVVLQAIKKHHFWILCGLVVLIGLAVWWSATSGLAGSIKTRRDELDGTMSKVKSVSSESLHANQAVIDGMENNQRMLTEGVNSAWRFLYDQQKKQMKWPDLGYQFRQYMDFLPPDAEIPDRFLDLYMNAIQSHFPSLYQIVDIRLPAELDETGRPVKDENGNPKKIDPFANSRGGFSGAGEGSGMSMPGGYDTGGYDRGGYEGGGYEGMEMRSTTGGEQIGIVDWNPADLKRIRNGLYWASRPATIQVRLAQEDLWVYEALLRIIAATNEGSTSYYNAAVKRIDALEIGQRAATAFAQSRGQALRGGMGGSMGYPGGMSGSYMDDMEGSMEGTDITSATATSSEAGGMYGTGAGGAMTAASLEERLKLQLLGNRYVDQDGMPISAGETTEGEFKMMPVRMLLFVDQRRIFRLLVNCANSALPVEVTKVALSPGKGSLDFARMGGSALGGGSYDEGGMMGGYPGGYPGGGAGAMMGGSAMYEDEGSGMGMSPGMGGASRGRQQTSYDIPIEIQGIIYIFSRPDAEKLGVGATAGATAAPPTAPPAAPPTAPGAPPPTAPGTPPPAAPGTLPPAAPGTPPPPAPGAGAPTAPPTPTVPATPAAGGAGNP